MTKHTLTVPAQHLERFRAATNGELESLTELMHSEASRLFFEGEIDRRAVRADDIQNTGQLVAESLGLVRQINAEGESVDVEARSETLADALHEMASASADALSRVLGEHPLDAEAAIERLESLEWALRNAARFREIADRERKAVAA